MSNCNLTQSDRESGLLCRGMYCVPCKNMRALRITKERKEKMRHIKGGICSCKKCMDGLNTYKIQFEWKCIGLEYSGGYYESVPN